MFLISLFVRGFLGEVAVLHLSGVTEFDSGGDRVVGLNKHSSVSAFRPSKNNHKTLQLQVENQFYWTWPRIVRARSSEVIQTPDCWVKDRSKISFGPVDVPQFFPSQILRKLQSVSLCFVLQVVVAVAVRAWGFAGDNSCSKPKKALT